MNMISVKIHLNSNSYLPMTTRPTKVTYKTATLIDNIDNNNISADIPSMNGIILNDITDHFPIHHIFYKQF